MVVSDNHTYFDCLYSLKNKITNIIDYLIVFLLKLTLMSKKPLMWKIMDKNEKEDLWPKRAIGHSVVYLHDINKYILIGGNFDAYGNMMKNIELNTKLISGIDKRIECFESFSQDKIKYVNESIANNFKKSIDVLLYDPDYNKWNRVSTKGRVPRARSFHHCIYIKPFIFCFGGLVLGDNGENQSTNEFFFLNIENYQWKAIICKEYPIDRTDFTFTQINETSAILFGGATSPSENYLEDLWLFKYEPFDYKTQMLEISKDFWKKLYPYGQSPGSLRAHAAEFHGGHLYVFGGEDKKKNNKNDLYKYDLLNNVWFLVQCKGKPPQPRCYQLMKLINESYFVVFSGIKGRLSNIEHIYDDIFIFNIIESTWFTPVIGGIQPSARFGFCLTPNYNFSKMEILIMGGYTKENDMKIYTLQENDFESKKYWTIRSVDYIEETNDEKFLLESEELLHKQKDKINNLEIENLQKEIEVVRMRHELEEIKKDMFKKHGIIDDQSQSMDEVLVDLEKERNKLKNYLEYERNITDLKQKLKFIMQRKNQKMMEFMCQCQDLFLKNYDTITKVQLNNQSRIKEIDKIFSEKDVEGIKTNFISKLTYLKENLIRFNHKEDNLITDMDKVKKFDKNIDDLFKKEIEEYKISDDSGTDYNINF